MKTTPFWGERYFFRVMSDFHILSAILVHLLVVFGGSFHVMRAE